MTGFTTELQIFPIPYAFGAPVGGDPLKFQQDFWHKKSRVPMLLRVAMFT